MAKERDEDKKATMDPGNILFILYVGFVIGVISLALVVDSRATVSKLERAELHLSEIRQGKMTSAGTVGENTFALQTCRARGSSVCNAPTTRYLEE